MPPWKLSIDAMLMILPPFLSATHCLATACERKNTIFSFRKSTASQFSGVTSMASHRLMIPALLTRMSMRSAWAWTCSRMESMAEKSERSARTSVNWPPSAAILAAVSSQLRRATPNTCAPAAASATQMPWPRPVLAPVTTAFLPFSEKRSIIAFIAFSSRLS